jgi:tetratricopeptide (TPR) repeat protein
MYGVDMKRKALIFFILVVILFLAAYQTGDSPSEPTMTNTLRPTEEITVTNTPKPKPTITPSPTVTLTHTPDYLDTSTPYPTFIAENIITATPDQPALCPVEDPSLILNPDDFVKQYLNTSYITDSSLAIMLSRGASFSQIKQFYNDTGFGDEIIVKDMTNDGVDELIYLFEKRHLEIFGCDGGGYKTIFYSDGLGHNIDSVEDLNLNGIPDLVLSYDPQANGVRIFHVYEWNGQTMEQMEEIYHMAFEKREEIYYYGEVSRLLRALFFNPGFSPGPAPEMYGNAKIEIRDLDHNGTKEILVKDSDSRSYLGFWNDMPFRKLELTLEWNGEKYLFSNITFSAPEFRFQAVQDADRYFLFRQYDEALTMYDEVINNTNLKPWSEEYMAYLKDVFFSVDPDSIAKPVMTLDEYQQLSAYARYRIMMIQLAQGKQSEAFNTYQLLDQIYTEDNPGYAHAEIGRRYWHAVEEGQDLVEACQVVIEYMQENPDLLDILGDYQHGQQTHYYGYKDICPLDETDVKLLSGEGE